MTKFKTKLHYLIIPIISLFLFSIFPAQAAVEYITAKQKQYSPNQILVKFKTGTSASAKAIAHGENPPIAQYAFKNLGGLHMLVLPAGLDVQTALKKYRSDPNVLYAETDNIVQATATNDPSFTNLWGINNTGQTVNGTTGTFDADMNIVEAWANSGVTGSNGVVIAVIDSGVQYNHPDLINNMWINPGEIAGNGVDDDANGYIDDVYGINAIINSGNPMDDNMHGTHVAGTIAAVGENSQGITGINQQAKILACKFLNAGGSGTDSDALKCLDYIYDLKMKGVNIIVSNNSWGGTGGGSQSMADAIEMQRQAGIIFVAAAGNSSVNNDNTPHYPSNYFNANLISVAATDQNDTQAGFSNYGKRSVNVAAPGVNILSSVTGSGYSYLQGTSMAAPHVAGLVALLSAEDPSRDWKTIKNLVLSSGTSISALNSTTTTGRRVRAWDVDGTGAMTCNNQTVNSVVYPRVASSTKIGGTKLGLAVLNINCASPAGSVTVSTSGPSVVGDLTLLDDGLEFDEVAGDGIYSAYWTAPASTGSYVLTFDNSETQNVTVIANTSTLTPYRAPVEIAYNPRSDASAFGGMPDNAYMSVTGYGAYYQVLVGGVNVSEIFALPQGMNILNIPTGAQFTGVNTSLPNDIFETLIGGYWDDLDVLTSGYGMRGWAYYNSGATPVGEVIFEWKAKHKVTGNPIQFQIVYTANSSDIEMHYITTDNNAESASVGVQVDWVRATSQSVNQVNPGLASGKAWKWSLDGGAPTANAGTDQNVVGNSLVTLSGTGTDPDGGVITYNWSQTTGTLVSITNSNTLTPTFYASNVTETLTFKLTVTDDAGQSATDTVNVNVTAGAAAGTLQFGSVTYSVSENGTNAIITITRSGGSSGTVGLSYATSDSSANSPNDYTYTNGTLSWGDADSSDKIFSVPIINDVTVESTETINLILLNITGGASLGAKNATLTIVDDDAPGTIGFTSNTFSINEDGVTATITVSRSAGSSGTVSVNYTTANYTADASTDYTIASGSLTWTDGDNVDKSFTVSIAEDNIVEGDEAIILTLSGETGGAISGVNSAVLTIVDNDFPPVGSLSFSSATYAVNENATSLTISVTRSGGSAGAISVGYLSSNISAIAGTDYALPSGTLNWSDGDAATKTFLVSITNNNIFDGNRDFSIALSSVTGGASIGTNSTTITIVDDEVSVPGTLSISNSSITVTEDGLTVTVIVSRLTGSNGAVSVVFATADDIALETEDYISTSGTLSWADGDAADKLIVITLVDDSVFETAETFSVGLSGIIGGATLGTASATIAIFDNDSAPPAPAPLVPGTISLLSATFSVVEGDETATITIERTGGTDGPISVNYAIAADTATLDSDFTDTSGTFSWADGDATAKTFTIIILDDQIFESDETVNISLSNLVGDATLGTSGAVLTIADNDAEPIAVNQPPPAPTLLSPTDTSVAVNASLVTFQWNSVTDPDGDAVTYILEYCVDATFTDCTRTQIAKVEIDSSVLVAGVGGSAGASLALFGLMGAGTRRRRVINTAIIIAAAFVMTACGTNIPLPGTLGTESQIETNLKAKTTYYWRVTAVDSNNSSSTSDIWSFTTR